jgi:hypothetical protein
MRGGVGSSTLLRIVVSLALLGAILKSPIRVPLTAPVPPNFLRRNFSLCRNIGARTMVLRAAAPAAARIKMIREKSEEGDHPVTAASAPLPPIAVSLAPSIGPPHSPSSSRPHLRC